MTNIFVTYLSSRPLENHRIIRVVIEITMLIVFIISMSIGMFFLELPTREIPRETALLLIAVGVVSCVVEFWFAGIGEDKDYGNIPASSSKNEDEKSEEIPSHIG